RELDQQVALVIDRVFLGVSEGILDVVGLQMKITAGIDAQLGVGAELGDPFLDHLGLEHVPPVGVRCRDDIGGAGLSGQLQHPHALLARPRPIVEPVEHVAMDVDVPHVNPSCAKTLSSSGALYAVFVGRRRPRTRDAPCALPQCARNCMMNVCSSCASTASGANASATASAV